MKDDLKRGFLLNELITGLQDIDEHAQHTLNAIDSAESKLNGIYGKEKLIRTDVRAIKRHVAELTEKVKELNIVTLDDVDTTPTKKSAKLTSTIRLLLIEAAKATGLSDIGRALSSIEESLPVNRVDDVKGFLEWVIEDKENRSYGYGNIEQRWAEYMEGKK